MTTEEKELLLKDLCARLPYGVKFKTRYSCDNDVYELLAINKHSTLVETFKAIWWDIEDVKPYLRPMSSMTEEEKYQYEKTQWEYQAEYCAPEYFDGLESYDWLNAHHFDYRGLIEKGLALEAPKEMYN